MEPVDLSVNRAANGAVGAGAAGTVATSTDGATSRGRSDSSLRSSTGSASPESPDSTNGIDLRINKAGWLLTDRRRIACNDADRPPYWPRRCGLHGGHRWHLDTNFECHNCCSPGSRHSRFERSSNVTICLDCGRSDSKSIDNKKSGLQSLSP